MTFGAILLGAAQGVQLAGEALDAIGAVTSSPGVRTAEEIVAVVGAILNALEQHAAGAITPEQVRAELAKLAPAHQANLDAAKAAEDAKFGPST